MNLRESGITTVEDLVVEDNFSGCAAASISDLERHLKRDPAGYFLREKSYKAETRFSGF